MENIFLQLLQITITKQQLFLELHVNVYFNKKLRFPTLLRRELDETDGKSIGLVIAIWNLC